MKKISVILAVALLATLFTGAFAESITFSGTVTVKNTHEIYAPIGGTVDTVNVEVGQKVSAGDSIATLATTKVYASESGTITGIFGQAGDSAETVSNHYGAVMYIEGENQYTVSASTDNAYESTKTKFVHVGESVYLKGSSGSGRKGYGIITSVQGTDYNVEVTSGTFLVGETVTIYRSSSASSKKKLGTGTLARTNPTAVTANGSIVSIAVNDGDTVERGDLLFETLDGSFDGLYMSGNEIYAGVNGVVGSISAQQGGNLQKNSVVAVIYPEDQMQITAEVSEYDLPNVAVGDPVTVELLWNQDENITYEGTISMISAISNASSEMNAGDSSETTYTVYIDFTPDENTRYGMSAIVSTGEDDLEADDDEDFVDEDISEESVEPEEEAVETSEDGE